MTALTYRTHRRISLKEHSEFNEKWLQDRISEDPAIMGLGELVLVERERRQERAGRLDLLMSDPDGYSRFEVEIQLGRTDESHIIRTIEYWDIERRRYPAYEHCAVLVAEDVTTRFINLLALFAGTIPMVVIQLNALEIGDSVLLDFVTVLDQRSLREDDQVESRLTKVDRNYWLTRSSKATVELIDDLLAIINEKADPKQHLNFNKYYVGLTDGSSARNFVVFRPRKNFLHLCLELDDPKPLLAAFEERGLSADIERSGDLVVTVAPRDLKEHRELFTKALHLAVQRHQA